MARTYALGPVKPHVRRAANRVGNHFGVKTIYGYGFRSGASDHPLGLALDFMVYGDSATGDGIAAYFIGEGAREYGVTYVIWKQRINSVDGKGWQGMEDRGGVTENHYDHVHVSFSPNGKFTGTVTQAANIGPINPFDLWPGGNPGDAAGGVLGGMAQWMLAWNTFGEKIAWLADSRNWLRIAMVLGGAVLILGAIARMTNTKIPGVSQVAKKASTAVKMKGT